MDCPCGSADFRERQKAAHLKEDNITYRLFFSECQACGRVGNERLFRNGSPWFTGIRAREVFRNMFNIGDQDDKVFRL